jgi:hypothetical protein
MRGKVMLAVGAGVGYVLGSRAGRERFDKMMTQAKKAWDNPTVQEAAGAARAQGTRLYDQSKHAVTDTVHKMSGRNSGSMASMGSSMGTGQMSADALADPLATREGTWDDTARRQNPSTSY